MLLQTISTLSLLAATVTAHGYVDNLTIAGVFYEGYQVRLPLTLLSIHSSLVSPLPFHIPFS
jgi:hypothetical protein